jgi:hypothetical protein
LYDAKNAAMSYAVDCTIEMFDSVIGAGGAYRVA